MSKAILVVDMPERCGKCQLRNTYFDDEEMHHICGRFSTEVKLDEMPEWCPLNPQLDERGPLETEWDVDKKEQICEIADYYGLEPQTKKCIEELGELIRALASGIDEAIIEELADVEIMIAQIGYLMDAEDKVAEMVDFKLRRTLARIERRKADGQMTWKYKYK